MSGTKTPAITLRRSVFLIYSLLVLAFLELSGWAFDVKILKHPFSEFASPNPLTLVNFILLSIAFLVFVNKDLTVKRVIAGCFFAGLAGLFAFYVFLDSQLSFRIHLDRILFSSSMDKNAFAIPSRMTLTTATCFFIASTALILRFLGAVKAAVHQLLDLLVMMLAIFCLLVYAYKAPELKSVTLFFPMAPVTAFFFILLTVAFLGAAADSGLVAVLVDSNRTRAVGSIALAISLSGLTGYLRLVGQWKGLYSAEFGDAIMVLTFMIYFTASAWLIVGIYNSRDGLKKESTLELSRLNQQLNEQIRELAVINHQSMTANEELRATNEELLVTNEQLETAKRTIDRQRDEHLNRVLDSTNDVIWSFDLTGASENYLSRSAERIYGEPYDHLLRKPQFWLEHLHPDDREIKKASQERLQRQGFTECTYRINLPTGIRWIHDNLRLIKDETGKPKRMDGIATDVTFIKEAERQIKKEHNLLRSLIDNIPDYIFVKDDQFRHIINNKANVEQLGAASEYETLGKTAEDYHGEKGMIFMEDDRQIFISGKPIINKEETIPGRNGIITVLTTKAPIKDENGTVIGLVGISRDITELKRQESTLNRYRENLEIVFSNSSGSFLLLDKDSTVILFNRAFREFLLDVTGIEAREGLKFMDVVAPHRKEQAQSLFEQALAGKATTIEAEFTNQSNKKIHHLLRYEPYFRDKAVAYVSISSIDITVRKEKENLLLKSAANLKSVLDATLDGIMLLDPEYNIVLLNESYRKLVSHLTGNELKIGGSLFDHIKPDRIAAFKVMLDKVKNNESVQYQISYVVDSKTIWYAVVITPVRTDQLELLGYCIAAHDDTVQKEAEIAIRASEERYKALVEYGEDVSSIIDFNGNVLFTSANLNRILGYDNLDSGYEQIIHPDDRDLFATGLSSFIDNPGKSFPSAMRIKHKDGHWVWMEGISTNLNHLDSVKGIVSIHRDVTARKLIEEDLKKAASSLSEFQKAIFRSSIVSVADRKGDIMFVNDNFVKISGYSSAELVGNNHRIINSGHHDRSFWINMWKTISGGKIWRDEVKNKAKDGSYYWVDTFIMPFMDEGDKVREFLSIRNDITERKINEDELRRNQDALREYNDRYEILSKATNDVIWDWDIIQDEIRYNHTIHTLLGYSQKDIKLESAWWNDRFHPDDRARAMRELQEIFDSRKLTWDSLYRYRAADGTYKYIHDRAYVVYAESGKPSRMIGAMQDVTELTEYKLGLEKKVDERTRELNQALQKEKELVDLKSKFVSIASHEFRTPLSTISLAAGFIKKYREKISADDMDKKLDSIATQVYHMTYLLDDVLTIGKSEAGKLKVNWSTLPIRNFFDKVAIEVTQSSGGSHEIKTTMESSIEFFMGDEKLMRNIVVNLLTNAIKFSPQSDTVLLDVRCDDREMTIAVKDAGIGIPDEDLGKLFESFYRGGNVSTISGTGLGLSIVKKAVDLLGGKIDVKTKLGKGTEFNVALPIKHEK